jgi:uncharacterized protein affecting Mg2+/Co2+ transport
MWGHYEMMSLQDRKHFRVDIPAFNLLAPMKAN